jgi:uncharacterized protein YhfF
MSNAPSARTRALILSRTHQCLLVRTPEGWSVPEAVGPWPTRPRVAINQHVHGLTGLTLPLPAGSLVPEDGRAPRDFAFVVDAASVPASPRYTWEPLSRALSLTAPTGLDRWLWTMYVECMLGGWEPPSRELDVFSFGSTPEQASRLAHLVTCGRKRGTAGWLRAMKLKGITAPWPGLVSLVTDGFGHPCCAIETVGVRTLRFADVEQSFATLEAEGDLTLEGWYDGHLAYFRREAEGLGLTFDENEEILLEHFRVLRVLGRADGA